MREILNMNMGWKFHYGDIMVTSQGSPYTGGIDRPHIMKAGNHGFSRSGFDDSDWLDLDLPDDFVIRRGEFVAGEESIRGSLRTGIGWYRNTFYIPKQDEGRRLWLEFDGVFRDSEVWMNGYFLSRNLSGYTSFSCDIEHVALYGDKNTIAVKADASEVEGWWYEGGGINRNVRLIKTEPLHIPKWGVFVKSELTDDYQIADIKVCIDHTNESPDPANFDVSVKLIGPDGNITAKKQSVGLSIQPYSSGSSSVDLEINKPMLWSCDDPFLYNAEVSLLVNGVPLDEYRTTFGIRDCRFDPNKGFFLNGESVKIKGTCNHEGFACVGMAVPYAVNEYRIQKLKEMGCNAYRAAHNPPDPDILDICDRLGMMVMDEARTVHSAPEYLTQLDSLIRRDRNHPSIIMWSLGNEEAILQGTVTGARIMKRLIRKAKSLDPTRPITYAMCSEWDVYTDLNEKNGAHFDIKAFNYYWGNKSEKYDEYHMKHPDFPIFGSENCASIATRGVYLYDNDSDKLVLADLSAHDFFHHWGREDQKGIATAYNNCYTSFGCTPEESLHAAFDREFIAGLFYWCGFDYRGETLPYTWPSVITRYGVHDLCGFPKDIAWYLKAWWTTEPVLHILPHWNWPGMEGKEIEVRAYSNMDEVEFVLNSRSFGKYPVPYLGYVQCQIKYEPGSIEAVGYKDGHIVKRTTVETVGVPYGIKLEAVKEEISADSQDTCIVNVTIVDPKGRMVPDANNKVYFNIKGHGSILGTGNGNPTSHERDNEPERFAYNGLCQVMVRAGKEAGIIRLHAGSDDLESDDLEINVV